MPGPSLRISFEGRPEVASRYARELALQLRRRGVDAAVPHSSPAEGTRGDLAMLGEVVVKVLEQAACVLVAEYLKSLFARDKTLKVVLGGASGTVSFRLDAGTADVVGTVEAAARSQPREDGPADQGR
jgi:hypothetical protein